MMYRRKKVVHSRDQRTASKHASTLYYQRLGVPGPATIFLVKLPTALQ
jgi:hypothetical protein